MWDCFKKKVLPDDTDSEPNPKPAPEAYPIPSQAKWAHLDPGHVVPMVPMKLALDYLDANEAKFPNKGWLTIIDFSQHSSRLRFYMIGLQSGKVTRHAVAHGKNSDPDGDGWATHFSNVNGSLQSCLGFVQTEGTYNGKYKNSLRLNGLSRSNSNMRTRAIVCHRSAYVRDGAKLQGRSWGCPALPVAVADDVIDKIKNGSLMLLWYPSFSV